MQKCEAVLKAVVCGWCVVWIWQPSHVGEPCNEAADRAADAAAESGEWRPLPKAAPEFASVIFSAHRGSTFAWALFAGGARD